ncbi:hypothetical protein IR194_12490 [Exiguobacterium sp. PBE]|uniref:hypothetical protein n=1 Tax=Exiguobacterium sp. S3 TaxID=483245 RepID=UPI0018DA9DAF|nr:hypothetical protein [Exiguobacterium sp. S3]QPI67256.1 hypothetical protein IR194_12490 [Exiguobacterium sp. PBE]
MQTLPIDGLFYIGLGTIFIVTALLGFGIKQLTKQGMAGFFVLLATSLGFFFWLLLWFQEATRASFMGTIPWVFNSFFGTVLYLIFIGISYLILRRKRRRT